MRSEPLLKLLFSIQEQALYPNEILIIDGSINNKTETVLKENIFNNLKYFKVEEKDRGLTKQRNFGINLVAETSEIICFLDDDHLSLFAKVNEITRKSLFTTVNLLLFFLIGIFLFYGF